MIDSESTMTTCAPGCWHVAFLLQEPPGGRRAHHLAATCEQLGDEWRALCGHRWPDSAIKLERSRILCRTCACGTRRLIQKANRLDAGRVAP